MRVWAVKTGRARALGVVADNARARALGFARVHSCAAGRAFTHTRAHVYTYEGGRERESTSTHPSARRPVHWTPDTPKSPQSGARRRAVYGRPQVPPQEHRCRLSQDVQAILHAPHIPLQAAAWQQWPSNARVCKLNPSSLC